MRKASHGVADGRASESVDVDAGGVAKYLQYSNPAVAEALRRAERLGLALPPTSATAPLSDRRARID